MMATKQNRLRKIQTLGQSVWLDLLRRGMLSSGELKELIDQDGLSGETSNPSIFDKAIAGSHDYDEAIHMLAQERISAKDISAKEMYERLAVEDVQRACDLFRPIYDYGEGRDGFVSIEVSPHLAYDVEGTIAEAHSLWANISRPNVMIKVPATKGSLAAIRQLISDGINVNVTLLFGLGRYRELAEAYIAGLQDRVAAGKPLERIASVASFFLSRIDVLVDSLLEKVMRGTDNKAAIARRLRGRLAIASARAAYQIYKEIFASEHFWRLESRGARRQRLLWASTGTKNPEYSDVMYVDALIGPETVNTMPLETLNAYRDHGNPASRLEETLEEASESLTLLPQTGIDLDAVTRQLEEEGVKKFIASFDRLMASLEEKRKAVLAEPVDRQRLDLGPYESAFKDRIVKLEQSSFSARLWRKDPSVWNQYVMLWAGYTWRKRWRTS
jgi:transaldolase